MARPKKIGLEYFPHDVDLSEDEKIGALESKYGNDGYAVYLKMLEKVYRAGGSLKIDCEDTVDYLAKKCNVDSESFKNILAFCVKKKVILAKRVDPIQTLNI